MLSNPTTSDLLDSALIVTLKKHYPHGYCGIDKEGSPVYYERLGMLDVKKILEVCEESTFMEYFMAETERTQWFRFPACRRYAAERGTFYSRAGPAGAAAAADVVPDGDALRKGVSVLDVGGVGTSFLSKTTRNMISQISSLMADNYPETAKGIYIVNCSRIATMLWSAVKPFINADTAKKIKLVNKNKTLAALEAVIERRFIPTFLGGDCDCGETLERECGPWRADFPGVGPFDDFGSGMEQLYAEVGPFGRGSVDAGVIGRSSLTGRAFASKQGGAGDHLNSFERHTSASTKSGAASSGLSSVVVHSSANSDGGASSDRSKNRSSVGSHPLRLPIGSAHPATSSTTSASGTDTRSTGGSLVSARSQFLSPSDLDRDRRGSSGLQDPVEPEYTFRSARSQDDGNSTYNGDGHSVVYVTPKGKMAQRGR